MIILPEKKSAVQNELGRFYGILVFALAIAHHCHRRAILPQAINDGHVDVRFARKHQGIPAVRTTNRSRWECGDVLRDDRTPLQRYNEFKRPAATRLYRNRTCNGRAWTLRTACVCSTKPLTGRSAMVTRHFQLWAAGLRHGTGAPARIAEVAIRMTTTSHEKT